MRKFSSYLLRTNPALTGNIKIVSDNIDIYFETFNSSAELSNINYKHHKVSSTEKLQYLIPRFLKNLDKEEIFYIEDNTNTANIFYNDFKEQYSTNYWAGADKIEDKWFTYKWEYFAPLYLSIKKIPIAFVIFRTDNGGNFSSEPINFKKNVIDNWKLIKFFSLDSESLIGQFIRNSYNDSNLPISSLTINLQKTQMSFVNGIDIKNGGFVSKSFPLQEELASGKTTYESDLYITEQFKTSEVIHPFILNMKWIFDDYPSTPLTRKKWSINNYHGFYIDDLQEVYVWNLNQTNIKKISNNGGFFIENPNNNSIITNENESYLILLSNKYYACRIGGNEFFVNCDESIEKIDNMLITTLNGKKTSTIINNNDTIILYKINFTLIEDLDMEIMDTKFSKYEYLNLDSYSNSKEPKFFLRLENENDLSGNKAIPDLLRDVSYKKVDFRSKPLPIPVSSEYTSELDTFVVSNNKILELWNKNQWISKFGYIGSKNNGDYPYRLNLSQIIGKDNKSTNVNNTIVDRSLKTLDWFYTLSSGGTWDFSTLHLDNNTDIFLDMDQLNDINYLKNFFSLKRKTNHGFENVYRWADFINTNNEFPSTIFNGINFSVGDVVRKNNDNEYILNGDSFKDYKITCVLTQRPKWKDDGNGIAIIDDKLPLSLQNTNKANYEVGCDLIRIKSSKSIIVWLWILIENRETIYHIPPTRLLMDDTIRDDFYNSIMWTELLDNKIYKPSSFDAKLLTAANLRISINNINKTLYQGGIRYCDIETDGTINYYTQTNSTWNLFSPSPIEIEGNVNFRIQKGLKRNIPITYEIKNILSYGPSYYGNVPNLNIYRDNMPTRIEIIEKTPEGTATFLRYNGNYDIITKEVALWKKEENGTNIYSEWDFSLSNWGSTSEWIWSKVSLNPLAKDFDDKIDLDVIIDEFGYQYGKRKCYTSSWSNDFFYESEKIKIKNNEKFI